MKARSGFIVLGVSFALTTSSISYAMPSYSVYNYAFNNSERYDFSKDFKKYLLSNGITQAEINKLYKLSDKYVDSLEELWEEVEVGYSIFDEVIFRDSEVSNEYNKALNKYGSQEKAYLYIKRSLVNNPILVTNKIKNVLKDTNKVSVAFDKKYGRKPTEKELEYLSDITTIKYALYGGFLGSELDDEQKVVVENGQGYLLLGLNENLVDAYLDFIGLRSKLEELEVKYAKSVLAFEEVRDSILKQSSVDIFKELSYSERLNIHGQATKGLFFDNNKAFRLIINKLKNKFPDLENIENLLNGSTYPNLDNENPYNDMLSSTSNKRINKILTQMFDVIYDTLPNGLNKKIEYLYFKYKDLDMETGIIVDELDIMLDVKVERLIKKIESSLGAKFVVDEKEVMMFLDNKIQVQAFEGLGSNEIELKDIKALFKSFGIDVYKKERVEDINIEVQGEREEDPKKTLIVEINDTKLSVELGSEDRIGRGKIEELLSKMDTKIVFFADTFIALREGVIYTPKELGSISYALDLSQLQKLLKDIGVSMVAIRVE